MAFLANKVFAATAAGLGTASLGSHGLAAAFNSDATGATLAAAALAGLYVSPMLSAALVYIGLRDGVETTMPARGKALSHFAAAAAAIGLGVYAYKDSGVYLGFDSKEIASAVGMTVAGCASFLAQWQRPAAPLRVSKMHLDSGGPW